MQAPFHSHVSEGLEGGVTRVEALGRALG